MAIEFHPRPGQILMCDFGTGFKQPELVKTRPVIVLTPRMDGRKNLVTVVGLSTVAPDPVRLFHCRLPSKSLPKLRDFRVDETWVKGDMVYAVGFHRLNLIRLPGRGSDGRRRYFLDRLGRDRMREVYQCVLYGLSLGDLAKFLPE